MTQEEFGHQEHIKLLSNHFLENDWVWLYHKKSNLNEIPSRYYRYWCYLAEPNAAAKSLASYEWDIEPSSPSALLYDYSYRSKAKNGFEHLTTIRDFKIGNKRFTQIRLCDEIIYYHNMFEIKENDITYYYSIFENERVLVCEIGDNYAKILNRFLIEFMAAKEMDLICVCQSEIEYDLNEFSPSFSYTCTPEKGISLNNAYNQNFNLMVNPCFSMMRNWFNGKILYKHKSLKEIIEKREKPIPFIIGEDGDGQNILANYHSNPYSKVYFRKSLLTLYKSGYNGISIEPLSISTSDFHIRCDNDQEKCIITFLKDVWELPLSEQKKWYAFNVNSDGRDFSDLFKQSIIKGNWKGEIQSKDFIFRDTYNTLLKKWGKRYKWNLIKPLHSYQEELIKTLIILPNDNPKELSNILQHICLLFQESFNIKSFPLNQEDKETRLDFFQRMLNKLGFNNSSLKEYLHNVQKLRSSISMAHHLGNELRKEAKEACDFFGLKYDLSNTAETSVIIFERGIDAMNSLIQEL